MTDFDNPWKAVLDGLFQECLEFFFPELHAAVDWSRGVVSLEQELRSISREAEVGLLVADKLVKVWRRDGQETWLLVHVEVQNQPDPQFAQRMFTSHYRIRDNYRVHPVSLAILGDTANRWRPNHYQYEEFGCRLLFQFPIIKLIDFESQRKELEGSKNPFARVVLGHLGTLATHNAPAMRYTEKMRLLKRLSKPEWTRPQWLSVLQFIDWLMQLPTELEEQSTAEINELEKGYPVPYISSFERVGIAKGQRWGIQKMLVSRFPTISKDLLDRLQSVDAKHLERLADLAMNATLTELEAFNPDGDAQIGQANA